MSNTNDFLLARFLEGDRVSFEKIYKSYFPMMFNYGRQFGIDEAVVDDAIQDIFIDIWQSRKRLKINVLKPYLFKCLRNKIGNILAKTDKEKSKANKYWHEEFDVCYDPLRNSQDVQSKKELEDKLREGLEQLSPRQREIIFLIYYNELSYADAADVLGIKLKTAYNQVHKAINTLRNTLATLLSAMMVMGFMV